MTTTDERPVLLLDVDGVLNLLPNRDEGALITRQTQLQTARLHDEQLAAYRLNIPVDAQHLVGQLAEHFDLRWYTMWNEHARQVFAPLAGITHEFDHLQCDWTLGRDVLDIAGTPQWMKSRVWVAKTPLIESHLGSRPFVWIDDDTTEYDTLWLENHTDVGEFLIITVRSHSGLTQDTVNEAIAWAQALASQEKVAS